MKYKLSKAFGKSIERLGGKELRSVLAVLDEVECASSIYEISDCKKLTNYNNIYRIRIGSRRAFFTFHIEVVNDNVFFRYLVSRGQAYDKTMEKALSKADKEQMQIFNLKIFVMRKGLLFLLGVITGILLTLIFALVYSHSLQSDVETDPNITQFDTPTEFTASNKFEVFQVLSTGALAQSRDYSFSSEIYGDPIVFIPAKGQNKFYDDQIIPVPTGSKVIQIGTFRYSSKLVEHVVPVIEIVTNTNNSASVLSNENEPDGEIKYAKEPSAFKGSNKFKIKEVLENGVIAECRNNQYSDIEIYDDPKIYIPADGQNMYYNNQIISIPSGKKAFQVGTIKLKDRYSRNVLPIVEFK